MLRMPTVATAAATAAAVLVVAAIATAAGPAPLCAEELSGRLDLLAKDGKGPARGSDPRQAVVYFEPAAGSHAPKLSETPFRLATHNKEFSPHILAVPVGSRVQFPNQDPILHNVFSVSPGNAFDLGIYRTGPPKEKRFDNPGLVRVYCNVHQSMVAYILVLDTAHYSSPGADGSFRLTGLPKGAGKLTVWHEQADPWSTQLTLPLAENAPPVAARLVVVRPKLPPHLNKTGESYSRGDAYR
jgi:plastocyanin